MITYRIQNIDIEKRGLYTAVYGHISDDFLGEDMKIYSLDQQMYLYLKSKGYDFVIFLDRLNSFYSFHKIELESFAKMKTSRKQNIKSTPKRFISNINSPLRGMRTHTHTPSKKTENESGLSPVFLIDDGNESFYKTSVRDTYSYIKHLVTDNNSRMALIVKSPNVVKMDTDMSENLEALFASAKGKRRSKFKLIVVYNQATEGDFIQEFRLNRNGNKLTFYSSFFGNEFFNINNQEEYELTNNCFRVNTPEPDEIVYMMHYSRLKNRRSFDSRKLKRFTKNIYAERMLGKEVIDLPKSKIDDMIKKFNNNSTWKELNDLIGLKNVKHAIEGLVASMEFQQERIKRGIINSEAAFDPLNYVFLGNPGTGKTTVGNILGQILSEIGILDSGHLVYVGRDDIVAGYVGQTAIKTKEKIEEARGGVLFIDEAYSLTNKGKEDFGHEAVEVLLKSMTEPRYKGKMAVIVAGYPKNMAQFIMSNPGLKRRFEGNEIHFDDYLSEELLIIFGKHVQERKYTITNGVREKALEYFDSIERDENFGNAGVAINLALQTIKNQNLRIKNNKTDIKIVTNKELNTILAEDILNPLPSINNSTLKQPINIEKPEQIADKITESSEEAKSFADEVMFEYDKNNDQHNFIRAVCDEIEGVLTRIINAYQGEESFEDILRSLENEDFKLRVETTSNYRNEINHDFFQEIVTGMNAFRLFFRGMYSINQNEIGTAVEYFNESLSLAESAKIEELIKTNKFLSKYWAVILSVYDGDFATVQSKLKDLKNDLELSNVGEQYRQMSDLMQADIYFISAMKSLSEDNIDRFTKFVEQAATTTEKVVQDAAKIGDNLGSAYNISLSGIACFYRTIGDMVHLFYKVDQRKFDLTKELSDLSIHTTQALYYFNGLDLNINARFINMHHLIKAFSDFKPFLQELSIIMNEYQHTGITPNEEKLLNLRNLSNIVKSNLNLIEDDSLKPWIEMCDDMIRYAENIEQQNYELNFNNNSIPNHIGYVQETVAEEIEIDYQDKVVVKSQFSIMFRRGRSKEAVDILDEHIPYIEEIKRKKTAMQLVNRFRNNRRQRGYTLHEHISVEERTTLDAILNFVTYEL